MLIYYRSNHYKLFFLTLSFESLFFASTRTRVRTRTHKHPHNKKTRATHMFRKQQSIVYNIESQRIYAQYFFIGVESRDEELYSRNECHWCAAGPVDGHAPIARAGKLCARASGMYFKHTYECSHNKHARTATLTRTCMHAAGLLMDTRLTPEQENNVREFSEGINIRAYVLTHMRTHPHALTSCTCMSPQTTHYKREKIKLSPCT